MATEQSEITLTRPLQLSARRRLINDYPRMGIIMLSTGVESTSIISAEALKAYAPNATFLIRDDVLHVPAIVTTPFAVSIVMNWIRKACVMSETTTRHTIPKEMNNAMGLYHFLYTLAMFEEQKQVQQIVVNRLRTEVISVEDIGEVWSKTCAVDNVDSKVIITALVDNIILVSGCQYGMDDDDLRLQALKDFLATKPTLFEHVRARHRKLAPEIMPVYRQLLDKRTDPTVKQYYFMAWVTDQAQRFGPGTSGQRPSMPPNEDQY